jgi:hypothetical protein
MKKTISLLILFCALTGFVFAEDGQIPTGGRSCPEGQQTCLFESSPQPQNENTSDKNTKNPILRFIIDNLKFLFR